VTAYWLTRCEGFRVAGAGRHASVERPVFDADPLRPVALRLRRPSGRTSLVPIEAVEATCPVDRVLYVRRPPSAAARAVVRAAAQRCRERDLRGEDQDHPEQDRSGREREDGRRQRADSQRAAPPLPRASRVRRAVTWRARRGRVHRMGDGTAWHVTTSGKRATRTRSWIGDGAGSHEPRGAGAPRR
jgi:hypothetical protein